MSAPGLRPIFIAGCERSGTTLLGSLLGAAPGAITVPESLFRLPAMREFDRGASAAEALRRMVGHGRFVHWGVSRSPDEALAPDATFGDAMNLLVGRYSAAHGVENPRVWVDHTPCNVRHALFNAAQFPGARFVHLVRDGRAVAASLMAVNWGPNTIHAAAGFWIDRLAHGLALETCALADRTIRVRYEDLLDRPEATLRRLCDFCGLEFTPQMLAGGRFDVPEVTRYQHALVGRPPDTSRATAWEAKLSAREVEIFEHTAGEMLALLGYAPRHGLGARKMRRAERRVMAVQELLRAKVVNPYRQRRRAARAKA